MHFLWVFFFLFFVDFVYGASHIGMDDFGEEIRVFFVAEQILISKWVEFSLFLKPDKHEPELLSNFVSVNKLVTAVLELKYFLAQERIVISFKVRL